MTNLKTNEELRAEGYAVKCDKCGRLPFSCKCPQTNEKEEWGLKEEFIEWHDREHAHTGYWPSNGEIADWWLEKVKAAHQAGVMECTETIPDFETIDGVTIYFKPLKKLLLSKFTRKE